MKTRQIEMKFRTHGGKRRNAGRKPTGSKRNGPEHRTRVRFKSVRPCHVTLRCLAGLPNLREKKNYAAMKETLRAASERLDVRIVHFSVQRNHLHLIVEAESWQALSAAMKGLEVRLAKAINRLANRKGRAFKHRYDVKLLGTPGQVRATLVYVLANSKKHARQAGVTLPGGWIDPRSSAPWFDGWANGPPPSNESWPRAKTWLLGKAWQKHGMIRVNEAPRV